MPLLSRLRHKAVNETWAGLTRFALCPGIPEIEVPPVEPLSINKLYMENGHGPVRVRAAFNNVTAFGASNYSINNVK